MENNQNSNKTGEDRARELPLHFRLMDLYLVQIEKSVPLMTTIVKDFHIMAVTGTQMALKAGKMLEERSKINVGFYESAGKSFEIISPVITEAQLGVTKSMVDSACRGIQLMRKTITSSK
jgi:hypothetical protein